MFIPYSARFGLRGGSDGEAMGGLEQRLEPMLPSAVGVRGDRNTTNGALWGRGEMSIESFPGDDVGMGGVVTNAKRCQSCNRFGYSRY